MLSERAKLVARQSTHVTPIHSCKRKIMNLKIIERRTEGVSMEYKLQVPARGDMESGGQSVSVSHLTHKVALVSGWSTFDQHSINITRYERSIYQ
jgi:hypothetical protein